MEKSCFVILHLKHSLDPCYFEQIDGVYEGDVDFNYRKEGLGMFISDSGEAYIGKIHCWHFRKKDIGFLIKRLK